MKRLYELFNDVDLDIDDIQEATVTDIERAQYKRAFKNQLSKKPTRKWKKGLIAACLSTSIATASIVGLSQTSFAKEIPILNNLFNLFSDEQLVKGYDEVAQQYQIIEENNGIKITLNQGLFDGKSVFLTYQIESNTDLGDSPDLYGFPTINTENLSFFSTKHTLKKIDNNQYIGLTVSTLPYNSSLSDIDFSFNIEKFIVSDGAEEIEGNWNFSIHTETTDNFIQNVDKKVVNNGLAINIEKIIYTPMSFIVNYRELFDTTNWEGKWDFIISGLHVKDDLGNTYEQEMNGGVDYYFMYTFETLHPDAKKLIITPYFELMQADGEDQFGAKYRNNNSTSPMEIIELDEIVVDIIN